VFLLALIASFGLVAYFEYIRIRRFHGGARELAAFVLMMIVAALYAVAVILDWPVPNPAWIVQETLGGIGEWIAPRS